jgi:catechol 2,3-dioxygenase-like lactoylglutathione lyase family enzyme
MQKNDSLRNSSLMQPSGILETCLYVDDLVEAERFYREVLGLEFHSRHEGRHIFFRCGRGMLLLFDAKETMAHDVGVPMHGAKGSGHVAFSVEEKELDAWKERLQAHGVEIEREIPRSKGGYSIYFRDPSGNSLEFAAQQIWGL